MSPKAVFELFLLKFCLRKNWNPKDFLLLHEILLQLIIFKWETELHFSCQKTEGIHLYICLLFLCCLLKIKIFPQRAHLPLLYVPFNKQMQMRLFLLLFGNWITWAELTTFQMDSARVPCGNWCGFTQKINMKYLTLVVSLGEWDPLLGGMQGFSAILCNAKLPQIPHSTISLPWWTELFLQCPRT